MAESSFLPSSEPRADRQFEIQLTLERLEGENVVQSVDISTEIDGTIKILSRGKFPSGLVRQFGRILKSVQSIGQLTGGDVIIEHEGHRFAHLRSRVSRTPRFSIHWWTIFRHALRLVK